MAIVRACAPTGNDKLVARGYAVLWRRPAGFAERTKVPQVFRQPRGSPALQKNRALSERSTKSKLLAHRVADLDQNFFDRIAVVDVQAFLAWNFQAAWIESQLVEHGGVDVGDVVAVLHGVEAEFVSGAVDDAALDA